MTEALAGLDEEVWRELNAMGYIASMTDPCMFHNQFGQHRVYVSVYVKMGLPLGYHRWPRQSWQRLPAPMRSSKDLG